MRLCAFIGLLALGPPGCRHSPPAQTTAAVDQPAAAAPLPEVSLAACCRQCLDASQRDPAGHDIRVSPCARYRGEWNGGPGVSNACAALFERLRTRVGQCMESDPAP